jgi:hypothetical protein
MSGGGSSPVVTQTQTKDPWSGAVPYLQQMYGNAQQYQQGGVGYQPWSSGTVAPIDPWQQAGNQFMASAAYANPYGAPAIGAGLNQATNIVNQQGITPGIQGAIGNLQNIGAGYSEPMGIYRQVVQQASGQQNPYLQQILDTQNRMIGDRINASMSGAGRYGSGQHTDVMARALAEAEAPLLQQDYEARQQRLGQAAQGMGGLLGQQAQVQGGIADIYGKGLQQAGQWAQLAPTLQQAQYVPGQMAVAAGEQNAQRAQQAMNDQINLWNAQQAYPWQQLQRESAILAGAGQMGGTTVGTQTQQVPLAQRLLGGALAGGGLGSAFGPVGAGAGALGGGLLGLL